MLPKTRVLGQEKVTEPQGSLPFPDSGLGGHMALLLPSLQHLID